MEGESMNQTPVGAATPAPAPSPAPAPAPTSVPPAPQTVTPPPPPPPVNVAPQMVSSPEPKGSMGATIGVIIILLVVIAGGWYFWNQRMQKSDDGLETIQESEQLEVINSTSASDETSSIDTDLNNTNIDDLDAELNGS